MFFFGLSISLPRAVNSIRAMSTFAAAEALRIVLREEQPAAMADVLLDLERSRMSAEDARGYNERARASTARTRVILDTTFDEFAAASHAPLVLLEIACGGLMAASRTVQR